MSNGVKWDFKPINELCIFAIDCVNKTAPVVEYKTPYKMIRTTNVKNGFIDLDTVRYVEKDIFDKWTRRSKPKYGDVILTREAPVGSVGRFVSKDNNVFLGQRLFHYRPNPELLDWNFLAYFLQSEAIQSKLDGMSFGATVDHITVEDAETLKIACPHISIQKKIGNILSNYDNLIENNNTRIKLLENMAEELYKEWFIRLRFPNYQNTKIVDGVPDGWIWSNIGESINNFDSKRKPISKENRELIDGIFPYYGAASILNYIDKYIFDGKYLLLGEDGTVITKNGTPMLQFIKGKFWVSNHAHVLSGKIISTEYLYLFFNSFSISGYITGTAQPKINQENLNSIKILIPSKIIIEEFDKYVVPIFENIFTLQLKNQNLKETRDLLLPRLISGKLDIKDMDIV